jgi:hypothetical protein
MISKYIGKLFPKYAGKYLDIVSILAAVYNPFIYERIISQTGIALGSYLLMIWVVLLLSLFSDTTPSKGKIWGSLIIITLLLSTTWMIYPHAILLILLTLGSFFFFFPQRILSLIIIGLWVIILNANWLYGDYVLWVNDRASKLDTFNQANIEVFQGNSLSGLGVDLTHLLGYGFWGERYHIVSPDDLISFWYVFALLVLGFVIYGGYVLYTRDKKIFWVLMLIMILAYILALGIASPIWGGFNSLLYERIPLYIGMREPQKWLALTQIWYMIFLSIGVISLVQKIPKIYDLRAITWLALALLPLLWTPASVIGYWGQLNISDYPGDIFSSQNFIESHLSSWVNILVFPWHSYMACPWTYGEVTANRSKELFYPASIISSDNIEIAHLYTNSASELSADIDAYVREKDLSLLEKNNISHILFFTNCADHSNYQFLDENPEHFEKIFDEANIDIYTLHYEK